MATFEPRTTPEGKTSYRVKIRIRGFPAQSATFERKTDAKNWAAQTESAIREGRYYHPLFRTFRGSSGHRTTALPMTQHLQGNISAPSYATHFPLSAGVSFSSTASILDAEYSAANR